MSKNKLTFGRGFREISTPVKLSLFPSQAPREIAPEIDVVESFRFETVECDPPAVRVRSDISMLFHAADTAKRLGPSTFQRLVEVKRPKSSSFQDQLDSLNLSDDDLLSMVKSRHIQSASEILDWSAHITELAKDLESEALKIAADEQVSDISGDGSDDSSGSSSSAQS